MIPMPNLLALREPALLFGHGQEVEDPKDGLMLFGPLDEGKPYGIRAGAIGTCAGLRRLKRWVGRIQGPITDTPAHPARLPFPGFEASFGIPWSVEPAIEIEVSENELADAVHLDDRHQRVFRAVDIYATPIMEAIKREDTAVDIWFVVIPDIVHRYCRPQSYVEPAYQTQALARMKPQTARKLRVQPSMFADDNLAAVPYHYEVDFHNQLKARLLPHTTPTQVVRESTLAYEDICDDKGRPTRDLARVQTDIAWNIATAVFYKAGGRPWKIAHIRDGVCYVGIVFKRDDQNADPRWACCAAQMFLDSGDGVVFRGAVGPWYSPEERDFHLSRNAARELVSLAVNSYQERRGCPPTELFLHGKIRFNHEEWRGFGDAIDSNTSLVGVRIRNTSDLKLYRAATHPVLRGLAFVRDGRTAYLWTKGFIPRLQTYPGREVPNPLLIDVCRGDADIQIVLNDIMSLTKLNYNACIFADGAPVTLRFADAVGEILTAGPLPGLSPLPFKYYI